MRQIVLYAESIYKLWVDGCDGVSSLLLTNHFSIDDDSNFQTINTHSVLWTMKSERKQKKIPNDSCCNTELLQCHSIFSICYLKLAVDFVVVVRLFHKEIAIFFVKSFQIFYFLCNFIFELSVISELCFEPVVHIGNLFIRIIGVEWMEMTTAKCGGYVRAEYYLSWKHILIAMSSSNFEWKILTRYLMVTILGLQFNFDWHLLFSPQIYKKVC